MDTEVTGGPRASQGPENAASPRASFGHVFLDGKDGKLHFLNEAARALHDGGVPFIALDPLLASLQTPTGEQLSESELPLLVAWRERRTVEATLLLSGPLQAPRQPSWSATIWEDEGGRFLGVFAAVSVMPLEPSWQIIAELAHDLRTPLHSLGLYASALGRARMPESQEQAVLEGIRAAAQRALHISKDLLNQCRGPSQKMSRPLPGWFPLESLLNELMYEHGIEAAKKDLILSSDLASTSGWEVFLDRIRLGRLLSNLLINAIRYTPGGGSVAFATDWRQEAGETFLVLNVRDTGAGISPEEQESIFDPYARGQAGKESDPEGSGLGLAVVEKLVDELSLRLRMRSEPGKGTAFELLVPERFFRLRGS